MQAVEFIDGKPTVVQTNKPETKDKNDVVVQVVCSAIDTGLAIVLAMGKSAGFLHSTASPLYLGWHFAGRVEAVGDGVSDLKSGDAVWGFLPYSSST